MSASTPLRHLPDSPDDPKDSTDPAADPADPAADPTADSTDDPAVDSTDDPAAESADDPADPTDDPADPADPTDDPADPADPTDDPADPADPTDDPADPADPTDDPADPADPTDDPADPADDPAAGPAADPAVGPAADPVASDGDGTSPVSAPEGGHDVRHIAVTVLCAGLVLGAFLLPNALNALRPVRFVRLPGEAIIGAMLLLVLPRRARTPLAVLMGLALAALTVLNVLDIGFRQYLGRGFNPVLDWELLDDSYGYLEDTLGGAATLGATAGILAGVVALFAVMALAMVRSAGLLDRHRSPAALGTLVAGTVWITCASLGLQIGGVPFASDRAAQAALSQARRVQLTLEDEARFEEETKADTFGATPAAELVPDLRGKDMVFAFIESYGRSAIEDPAIAPGVNRTLDARTEVLEKAGFGARSGWLTSATYGGSSWLGHSTFLSGLWVANQQRYRTVTSSDHLTLTKAFQKTGAWRTVGIMPGIRKGWPEAEFYGLDHVYDSTRLGYEGPKFSWSTMPDQYALEAFQRLEHGRKHDKPLMAEVILTSSHQPWAPVPRMVGWDELGDGRIFEGIEKAGLDPEDVIADSDASKREYGRSVQYSVTSLTEWLQRYGTDDTVLVFLGDHQPIARVSGDRASRDVPVTVVAKDPKVLEAIDDWGWTQGLRPSGTAPVWKMSAFRDRFLKAYGSTPRATR